MKCKLGRPHLKTQVLIRDFTNVPTSILYSCRLSQHYCTVAMDTLPKCPESCLRNQDWLLQLEPFPRYTTNPIVVRFVADYLRTTAPIEIERRLELPPGMIEKFLCATDVCYYQQTFRTQSKHRKTKDLEERYDIAIEDVRSEILITVFYYDYNNNY